MLDDHDRSNVRFVASMAVQSRRAAGKDEATIRREAMEVGVKAIERHVGDQGEQEVWLAELERSIDREIADGAGDG